MTEEFYSLTEKKKVALEVTGKRVLANGRFQILASYQGKTLMKFVGKDAYEGKFKGVAVVK